VDSYAVTIVLTCALFVWDNVAIESRIDNYFCHIGLGIGLYLFGHYALLLNLLLRHWSVVLYLRFCLKQ